MPGTKLIQQETTLNVEPTSEANTLFVPNGSISYPEEEVSSPTEQASLPLEDSVNVSVRSSYKSLSAKEEGEIEQQAHEPAAIDELPVQLSTDPESEVKPQEVPKTEFLPTSETQLPILEPLLAEETHPNNSLPGLTEEIPQEDSENIPTSLNMEPKKDKVDAPHDPTPLLQEEYEKSTIDVPISEVEIDSTISDEQTDTEPKTVEITMEPSINSSSEAISFDGSNENCINDKLEVGKNFDHTLSEDAIFSNPDGQASEGDIIVEELSAHVPLEDHLNTTEKNTAELSKLACTSAPVAEASPSLVHDETRAPPSLENTSLDDRLTENKELVTDVLLVKEIIERSSSEDLVSNPDKKSLENTQVALELSDNELPPEVSSEVVAIQSINQISSEYEQKDSFEDQSITPISTATVEPASVDTLVAERITKEPIPEEFPSLEPEQKYHVSEALTDKVSTEDPIGLTNEAIGNVIPTYCIEAIVNSEEGCVEASPVLEPFEGSCEPPSGSAEYSGSAPETSTAIEPSALEAIVLRSVEQKSEPQIEDDICDEAIVEASFIAERVTVETFVAELVEEHPAESSSIDTQSTEKVTISAEPITQASIEEPVKQDITDMQSIIHTSPESPGEVDTISENSPLELSKAPESSELPIIEQDSPDSPTFSDAVQEVSIEVPVTAELKEKLIQESIPNLVSDSPASATSVDESIVKEETPITPETTSEPGTPGEPTVREPKPEEPNSNVVPATETLTDSQAPNTDSEVKSPSKAEGYKKMLKGAFQMSIGALFRRRSLKTRGKENKIDGKLEVEVARASGNIQTSSVQ